MNDKVEEKEVYENSKKIMASYGSREMFGQWITGAFGFSVFFFYEVVIGLDVILGATVMIIYSIWNAFNDPIIGYIMERIRMPWEKKWNIRRFPWIIIGGIPWLFSFLIIFLVPLNWHPINDQWLIFGWYLFSLCLYDTLLTLYDVNAISLYPDKFRGLNERRTAQSMGTILGIIGIVLSAIIPPMFITTGVAETYRISATVSVGIGLLFFLFLIPGVFENRKIRELYKQRSETIKEEKIEPFFKSAKKVITDRVFMVKVIFFFGYQAAVALIHGSGLYIVTFIMDLEASALMFFLGAMLVGALVSVPLWLLISQKVMDNKKMSLIGGIVMLFTFLPMIFVVNFLGWIISLILFGVGLGGQWFMDPPTMGDVLDDIAVRTGKRQQSIYYGYQAFFIRLSGTFQAIIFAIVHTLTGFVEGAPSLTELISLSPTPDLALFGIRIHSAIVPAILVLITIFLFWKFYDLTPEKVAANKKKLEELGI